LTRQRIATIEVELRTYDLLWFVLLPLDFLKPQTGLAGALEELNILKDYTDGQRTNILHLAEVCLLKTHEKLIKTRKCVF